MLAAPILTELLERAQGLDERLGIVVGTNNAKQLQVLLCNERTRYGADVEICIPAEDNTVFIVKRSVELD